MTEARRRFERRWPEAARALETGPAFRLETGRRGAPTLVAADGRTLHSRYDPAAEARRLVEAAGVRPGASVAVFAAGLGYLALAAAEAIGPPEAGGRLLLLEPFPRALALGLEALDWTPLLDRPGVEIVAAAEPRAFAEGLARARLDRADSLVANDSALPLLGPAWAPVRARLEDLALRARSARRFAADLAANRRANAPALLAARPVRGLFGALAATPGGAGPSGGAVVVAGAGPSLAEAAEAIAAARDRCLVVAAAAALGPLEAHGLEADLAVLSDPQPVCAGQVAGRSTPLVAFPTSSAEALAAHAGPLVGAVQTGEGGAAWAPLRAALGALEAGGSVVTTALDLAVRLGAGRVVLAGVDLAFAASSGQTHARGYDRLEAAAAEAGRFRTVETRERAERPRRLLRETAVDGSAVETYEALLLYRRWIEGRIRRAPGVRFVQTARRGLPIEGAEAAPVEAALAGAPAAPRLDLPPPLDLPPADRERLRALLEAP